MGRISVLWSRTAWSFDRRGGVQTGTRSHYSRRDDQTVAILKTDADSARQAAATALLTGLESDGAFTLTSDGQRLVYTRAP